MIRPIRFFPFSVNQSTPSGPVVIPSGLLPVVGIETSVIDAAASERSFNLLEAEQEPDRPQPAGVRGTLPAEPTTSDRRSSRRRDHGISSGVGHDSRGALAGVLLGPDGWRVSQVSIFLGFALPASGGPPDRIGGQLGSEKVQVRAGRGRKDNARRLPGFFWSTSARGAARAGPPSCQLSETAGRADDAS